MTVGATDVEDVDFVADVCEAAAGRDCVYIGLGVVAPWDASLLDGEPLERKRSEKESSKDGGAHTASQVEGRCRVRQPPG
jgi:hypothetical protein